MSIRTPLRSKTKHGNNQPANFGQPKKSNKKSISAKPDTLQEYSFSEVGAVSGQLPMKTRKNDKRVSNYPFLFLEKKTTEI